MSACMKEQYYGECCCNCVYHLADYHHCTTPWELRTGPDGEDKGCVCGIQKGWVCAPEGLGGRVHSGWTEHGICEMHRRVP